MTMKFKKKIVLNVTLIKVIFIPKKMFMLINDNCQNHFDRNYIKGDILASKILLWWSWLSEPRGQKK